ncbi:MAG: hypothetical protein HY725_09550 [Candidatus Rokubacteria bacterium]|nr:hypothetical protein [Candidatus Rokubacteria bacterium]
MCYLILILLLFPQLDDTRTFKPLALTINHEWRPGDQIVMTTLFPRPMSISQGQTDFIAKLNMSFYLNQPFTFLADPHALRQALASEQRVFCVIGRRIFEAELEGRNIVSHLLASRPVFRATGAYPQLRLRARHEALPDAVLLISNRPSTRTGGNERRRPSVPRAHDRLARYPD